MEEIKVDLSDFIQTWDKVEKDYAEKYLEKVKPSGPIIVNLLGGPGCGKSSLGAYIFSKLKMLGVNAELITEVAKDKTWEKNFMALDCQPYIFGKQCYRMDRCKGQVDVIVTDSPLILTSLYNHDKNIEPEFSQVVLKKFLEFRNICYFLNRQKEYNPIGRNQTEEEAKQIDTEVKALLKMNCIPFLEIPGTIEEADKVVDEIYELLTK